MKSHELVLNFRMGYGMLHHTCRLKADTFRRDLEALSVMGITESKIVDLEKKAEAFRRMRFDEHLLSKQTFATDYKNEIAEEIKTMLRMVKSFILESEYPEALDFFDSLNFSLFSDSKIVHFVGKLNLVIAEQDLYNKIELNEDLINEINDKTEVFCNATKEQTQAILKREVETQNRRQVALDLYKTLSKYCKLAQTYWFEKDEARYNDYFIYKPIRKSTPTQQEANDINPEK